MGRACFVVLFYLLLLHARTGTTARIFLRMRNSITVHLMVSMMRSSTVIILSSIRFT